MTNPYRGLLPDLPAWACEGCGHWQRWPEPGPLVCPVCADVRNALPEKGFRFVTPDELALTCHWAETAVAGVTEHSCAPRFGLDSKGWVIESDAGRVGFEAAPFYDAGALAHLREQGGLQVLAASHVHGYGALWQLQEALEPEVVAIGVRDLVWTKAFRVTWPVDERLELATDLTLHRTGGHFDGHNVLHDRARGLLFCGDALKVDVDAAGRPTALSAHKAFHAQIPLSHAEVRAYREVVRDLEFGSVFTPFEHVDGITTDHVVHLLDRLLAGPPAAGPVPLEEL